MPSARTSVRLTPLGPMPRSDTPCEVGCDDRLLVRRNKLNVGIWRSTSSATTAGEALMSSLVNTLTLAGISPTRCSLRVGVTVTVSSTVAGDRTTSRLPVPTSGCSFTANPPARTMSVAAPDGSLSRLKRPSGPVTVCWSPDSARTTTEAPATAPPLVSLTTPVIEACASKEKTNATSIFVAPSGFRCAPLYHRALRYTTGPTAARQFSSPRLPRSPRL